MKLTAEPDDGLDAIPGFPVVLITVDNNIMTAAAFSFYSFKPPSVMVGIIPENLTFELIAKRREFGINFPTSDQFEEIITCGTASGRDENKFETTGFTPVPGEVIGTSLIAECPLNLECQVVHQIDFGGSHCWFVGEIVKAHIEESYRRDRALMYWNREFRRIGAIVN
jgi:flavin reductase (DIM6/NTAB) family NADH-FMN oxidoreductase RutF